MLVHSLHIIVEADKWFLLIRKDGIELLEKLLDIGLEIDCMPFIMYTIQDLMIDDENILLKTVVQKPMGVEALLPPPKEHGRTLIEEDIPSPKSTA